MIIIAFEIFVLFSVVYLFIFRHLYAFKKTIPIAPETLLDNSIKKHNLTQLEVELLSVISAFHPYCFHEIATAYRKVIYLDVLLVSLSKSVEQNVTLDHYIETVILKPQQLQVVNFFPGNGTQH